MFRIILGFIWFVLALLGARFALRWLDRLFGPKTPPGPIPDADHTGRTSLRGAMVKDPVCGTWLDPQIALRLGKGSEETYFCSEACRDKFRLERRK